jgi:hypothetical protein
MLPPPDDVTRQVKQLRIIWFALMLGVANYSLVVWALLRFARLGPQIDIAPTMQTYAAVIIILILPLARIARNKVSATPPNASEAEVRQKWAAGFITGAAVREAVGIAGITLAFLTASIPLGLGFAAASIGSQLLAPPWEHELRIRLRRISGGSGQTGGWS